MFFCIVLLTCISVVHGKTSGTTTSSYGYSTTPTAYVAGGTYMSGRNSNGQYYRSGGSGCTSTQCGQTTCGASGEVESLCSFTEGSCASHGCQAIVTEEGCAQAAIAAGAQISSTTPTPWGATTTQSACTQQNACTYNSATNQMSYCGNTYSSNCYVGTPCVCWCVVQDIWSSEDQTGAIVGIIFGLLFAGCIVWAAYWFFCKPSPTKTYEMEEQSDNEWENNNNNQWDNNNQWGTGVQTEGMNTGATWGETNYNQNYNQPPTQTYSQPPTQTYSQPPTQTYAQPPTQTYAQPPPQTYAQPPAQTYAQPPAQTYNSGPSYNNAQTMDNSGGNDADY